MITLRPYQVPAHDALVRILQQHPAAIDSSDVGTGKTFVAIKVAESLGLSPLVVCPKAVAPAWEAAFKLSGVPHWSVGTYEYLRTRKLPFARNFFIFDEVHRCKGRKTHNSKLLQTCAAAGKTLLLSATAASNPLEMYALGRTLDLYPLGGYWSWVKEHGCKKNFFGGLVYKGGVEGMSRIHDKIYPHRGVRLKIENIPDFPDGEIQADVLDFGDTRDEMAAELARIDEAALLDKEPDNPLTMQLRERQRTELLKVPLLVEMAEDLEAAGKAVVVFVNFNETLDALQSRLKVTAKEFSGRNVKDREAHRVSFQKGDLTLLIVNIKAGGVGLSLHDEFGTRPRVALICPTFSIVEYRQALGRVRRSGGKSKSLQKIIFAAGTVEERVAKLLNTKGMNLDALNDSDLTDPDNQNKPLTPLANPPIVATQTSNIELKIMSAELTKPLKISPSGLKNVRISPCFENDQTGDKTAADEGTMMHAVCETGNFPLAITDEQRSSVMMCLNYIAPLVNRSGVKVYKELVFDELNTLSPSMRRGKADLLVVGANSADLVDYKMGRNAVDDAESNDQAQAYVLAIFMRFPEVQAVKVHLVCPRRDEVSTHTFKRSAMAGIKASLVEIVAQAELFHVGQRTSPHVDTCSWCAKRHSCPAMTSRAVAIARAYDTELKIPTEFHPSNVTDPDQMSKMMDVAQVMDKWAQSARHHFTQSALNGNPVPGWELREKKGARTIDDALSTWTVVQDTISQEKFLEACSISVPDLEKAYLENAPRGQKGKLKETLMEKLIEAGTLKQGAPAHFLARIRK